MPRVQSSLNFVMKASSVEAAFTGSFPYAPQSSRALSLGLIPSAPSMCPTLALRPQGTSLTCPVDQGLRPGSAAQQLGTQMPRTKF